MVTIKQLAEICGVSRGTVDRVLNNRGNVKPEKRDLILRTAKKLNYQPNPAGKALITRKKKPVVAIVLPAEGIVFFDDLIGAMKEAESKYNLFGLQVLWKSLKGYDVDRMVDILYEVHDHINALIINPINHPKIIEKLNQFMDEGIFVVTVNNDVEQAKPHCYVGSDYVNGGETAAGLLQMITRGERYVGVSIGSHHILGHEQRLKGFHNVLDGDPRFHLVEVIEDEDDDIRAFDLTKQLLLQHEEINTFFMAASGGSYGVCRAVMDLGREKDITIVTFDTLPKIVELMKEGVVDAAIYQHPRHQGARAMRIVYDYLFNGLRPEEDRYILKNEIRIKQNI